MAAERPDATAQTRLQKHPLLHDHPIAWRVAVGLWFLSALLFLALAVPVLAAAVQSVDDVVYRWAVSIEWGPAVVAAKVLDFIGNAWVTWPVMVGVAGWLAWRRRWEAFFSWTAAMAVSQLLIGPVKELYMRPRPPMSLVETTSWSFPSGHSVAGAAISITLVIVLIPAGPKRRNYEMLAGAFAVIMALSRVYLRAHWLTDVASGAALGAAVAIGSAALMHRFDDRRRGHRHASHRR
jgi:membrane-associated phospholipid phosphatase